MVVVAFIPLVLGLAACGASRRDSASRRIGGDPALGQVALQRYGCVDCHTIPGVPKAKGAIGPPLTSIGRRMFIVEKVPNTPENMMRWIQQPRSLAPNTKMPNLGVTDRDSRNIAAYLYTLR